MRAGTGVAAQLAEYTTLTVDLAARQYTVTGLQEYREYSVRVWVRNLNAEGYVNAESVRVRTAPLPPAPVLHVTEVSPFTVTVAWTVPGLEDEELSFEIGECCHVCFGSDPPCFDAEGAAAEVRSFAACITCRPALTHHALTHTKRDFFPVALSPKA